MSKNKIKLLAEVIKRLSKLDIYYIKIESKTDRIFDSKIGGIPYWSPDKNYPTNSTGRKLYLLAQVNFDEEKADFPLPKSGILQFFIDDDLFGMNSDQTKQDNFRVVYHETIDYNMTKDAVEKLGAIDTKKAESFPINDEYKISLHKGIDYIGLYDINFHKFFALAYKEVYNKDIKEDETIDDVLGEDEIYDLEKELETNESRHKMLGYPIFAQEDPRNSETYKDYETLLLQINSEGEYILWGDAGVGNFFISKKALEEKDFSNVLYNWDCT